MGRLIYNSVRVVQVDDRTLAHLQLVVVAKLRRQQPFQLTLHLPGPGPGRVGLWLSDGVAIEFEFDGPKSPAINRRWIDVLMEAAHSAGGLTVVSEPPA